METVKIMPCLDMKEGRVVKGINFVDLKDAGDPVENASFYQREGADELAMLDIAATVENRKTRLEWVSGQGCCQKIWIRKNHCSHRCEKKQRDAIWF
jgi:imidazole glycerol phosphate synthase subunit HisF